MKQLLSAFALVAGLAHADNISLFGPPKAPVTPAYQSALEAKYGVVQINPTLKSNKLTPVSINPYAVNATIITAEVEGKGYRFVGKISTLRTRDFVTYDSWNGISADGDTARLEFRDAAFQYGLLDIGGEHYSLRPDAVLTTGGFIPEIRVAGRLAWAQRNSENNFVRSAGPVPQDVGYCGTEKVVTSPIIRNCKEYRARNQP